MEGGDERGLRVAFIDVERKGRWGGMRPWCFGWLRLHLRGVKGRKIGSDGKSSRKATSEERLIFIELVGEKVL